MSKEINISMFMGLQLEAMLELFLRDIRMEVYNILTLCSPCPQWLNVLNKVC